MALGLVKPVYKAFGAATASGNKSDRRGKMAPMRFPGNVAICSHRFLTIGRIRVGERQWADWARVERKILKYVHTIAPFLKLVVASSSPPS
jgi:hypothetical protein